MDVVVGRISRAHGVRGEVAVELRTDQPDERFAPGVEFTTDVGPLRVQSRRWHGSRLLVTFEGYADRTAAESLRGLRLVAEVPDDERPDDPDEYYDHQLVGLRVSTRSGDQVGVVTEVIHLPMQEVLAVRTATGQEVLVPFVAAIVPEVDLEQGVAVIDPPEGLIESTTD